MGIGADIEEVIEELGPDIVVYNHSTGTSHTDHFDYDRSLSSNSPFDSSYFINGSFSYNTQTSVGDKLTINANNDEYLIAVLEDDLFEQEVIAKEGVLCKCNATFDIKEYSGERDENYVETSHWNTQISGESGLVIGRLSEHDITETRYSVAYTKEKILYASSDLDIRQDNRCVVNGEEYFKVDYVEVYRLPGLKMCQLSLDTRE